MASVEIFTTMFCPFCHRAKKLLDHKGIAYEEVDVMFHPSKRQEMTTRAGSRTVPQVFVDGVHVGNCDEIYALEAAGELDDRLTGAA